MKYARRAGLYAIVNTLTGVKYYGSARILQRRWWEHRRRLRLGEHHNAWLQNSWNKYGEDAFKFCVIAVLEMNEVRDAEQRLLEREYGRGDCCNISRDVDSPMSGRTPTAEHRAKLSAAMCGKKMPPDAVKRAADGHRGKPLSAEHRAKLAAAQMGRKQSPNAVERTAAAHRGRKRSPETRARIAAAKAGKPLSQANRDALAPAWAARVGTKRSAESVAKTAAFHRGRVRSEAERAAISAGMTEEGRRKLSEQKRAYWAAWRAQRQGAA